MAKCKYCNEKAGFFRWKHEKCESDYMSSETILKIKILEIANQLKPDKVIVINEDEKSINLTITYEDDDLLDRVNEDLNTAFANARNAYLEDSKQQNIAMDVCFDLLDDYLADQNFSDIELGAVTNLMEICDLESHSRKLLLFKMMSHARILTRLEGGERSENIISRTGKQIANDKDFPLLFMKSEKLIHATYVMFHEERTKTHYVGRSDGVSIKIRKGLYYRTSGFRGERVQEHNMEHIDSGIFALTTKHIYFHGHRKSFRTRIDRIVAIEPFEDGIGIRKAGTSARPQIFKDKSHDYPINSWFVANAIRLLNE